MAFEELLTEKQAERRERDEKIAAQYNVLRLRYPTATRSKVIQELARLGTENVTSYSGIRAALIRTKTITVR